MTWKKRQLVTQAFEEIGLASYVFDLTPEQLQSAVARMDAMVHSWEANGVRIGYSAVSDLDEDSGIVDGANEAVYLNLAVRLAPSYGKVLPNETKASARAAYVSLANRSACPVPEMQFPTTLPLGGGVHNVFAAPPDDPLLAGPDGEIVFE